MATRSYMKNLKFTSVYIYQTSPKTIFHPRVLPLDYLLNRPTINVGQKGN